ncbi:MAG: cysteine desulfurase family protein [Peptoniphilaceae bacterium]|uniref:cysteine desulfurase family protein n=1 Tax=Parvimonas sp. TaxID=1944660 RepID=UPI0025F9756E|nr:cysteine desulfurase family protein [Parvimonas sp.]MCI5997639.1 cysteine desulfurase [Parvimonas sp.]MDD7765331.1 cysteine desulfurase family protein [Peptoniphilaceae bacterium]MDY3051250.1 cysteine desulfurase family protein [Parvimonas sp.]
MDKIVYFDNSATTELNDEVFDSMKEFLIKNYSNPSSIYEFSQKSKVAIEKSRENISEYINANKNEVFFTSSGTESDNWALVGSTVRKRKVGHIITSAFEHSAVLETVKFLETMGFEVSYVFPNSDGFISSKDVVDCVRDDTVLVSIMYVNNEVGTVQNIKQICEAVKEKNSSVIFHTDAVQALSELKIDVKNLDVDLLTVSAHKVHGPKGVGALYIKSGVEIENFIFGGSQERNRRGGTENVAGIVGFSKAIDILRKERVENVEKRLALRKYFIGKLEKCGYKYKINGSMENRHSSNINVSFLGFEKEMMIMNLDFLGICVSSGSACSSGSIQNSHVLESMNLPYEQKNTAIRISLSENNTFSEIDYFFEMLKSVLN